MNKVYGEITTDCVLFRNSGTVVFILYGIIQLDMDIFTPKQSLLK